jgi:hypothetical protein
MSEAAKTQVKIEGKLQWKIVLLEKTRSQITVSCYG